MPIGIKKSRFIGFILKLDLSVIRAYIAIPKKETSPRTAVICTDEKPYGER
jgi:hypothetical protein